ncbi:D-alanyl-D-alanine carboxypeptidase [Testudinibacter sp. TR-2022]|uniref:D-alanyl-D-alanine carboxypeptidase family protein n=1 Tax=Testudinibacter sp. TR-2022 TaxID=2585029 RepID=UPI00111A9761|nr:serine hydrolase [Testudinibacter sp. TR-2022]TNH04298.1 D-alanyl-D-alanine carboxypeptidase [Pasteurellaceae bacterium Phil31]TNH07713.1 D-alanyl-D-alanine carboxypeptidase [Testudinibacter sp. TR-2022]TNH10772.1 D-alanyl-D-alanine carboxypeptidase [Testudinibacter sp. TR-2022]TNH16315.1 D-alanyl-D-alanine carboxypeptidase [Testudinibacter sp. TR-2022]TNH19241.1 D-alanyl-D-alanine carboxypeptidase [Testudinibacter sp. TR-2022]
MRGSKQNLLLSALFLSISPLLSAQSYVVYDFTNNKVLESRSPNSVLPIASVTKLMTANVFLENNRNPNCTARITNEDNDHIKGTRTKLPKNTPIACSELLKAMFVHSDNYAAHALSRSAGMSRARFIQKMNEKAQALKMKSTRFSDSSGLSNRNISSVMDLVKLAKYSLRKPELKALSNTRAAYIRANRTNVFMQNTNKLVREEIFDASISKTGYIRESGYNLVFINKYSCNNNATIGVISLNNKSSAARSNFTKNKLKAYGCLALNDLIIDESNDQDIEAYDQLGLDRLIEQVSN